jgi:hypothetical protein
VGESLKPPLTAPIYHFRWDSAGRGKAGEDRDCTGALARECCVSRRAGASPYVVLARRRRSLDIGLQAPAPDLPPSESYAGVLSVRNSVARVHSAATNPRPRLGLPARAHGHEEKSYRDLLGLNFSVGSR